MQCTKCGTLLGINYLRCPSCGTKVAASSDTAKQVQLAATPPWTPQAAGHQLTVPPVAALAGAGRVALPPLPRNTRKLRLAVLISVAFALAVAALAVGNILATEVRGTLNARFDGSWERAVLQPQFVESSWLSPRALEGDAVTYAITRADGTVLHSGASSVAKLIDADLGSQEPLLARACVYLTPWYSSERQSHCATTTLTASAKRFVPINMTVSYPRGGPVELPVIAFQQELQRSVFGQDDRWSQVRVVTDAVRLKIWVANSPDEAVQLNLPPSKTSQTVDLRSGDGFAAFLAAFQRAEAASPDVNVQFQFHTSTAPESASYPVKSVTLQGKSQDERLAELQSMALKAAWKLVGSYYGGGQNISAQVLRWTFDPRSRSYAALLRISWNGRNQASNSYWIEGQLSSAESGEGSQFELTAEGDFTWWVRGVAGLTLKVGNVVKDLLSR